MRLFYLNVGKKWFSFTDRGEKAPITIGVFSVGC